MQTFLDKQSPMPNGPTLFVALLRYCTNAVMSEISAEVDAEVV